jgi:hypothetical protein
MKDERYTVENPPEDGCWVYQPMLDWDGCGWFILRYDATRDLDLLKEGLVHPTLESAEAHARRMLMVDDILRALEGLIKLSEQSPGFGWDVRLVQAKAIVNKARGEGDDRER